MTPLTFFIAFLCDNFLEKLIFWEKLFLLTENFHKKIIIVISLGVKVGMELKMTPQTIFIAFLCDNFLQNLEFPVFPNHFPAKNIPKNQIIFCETFGKSLTRLSRLLKVSSRPRLSRLANATSNVAKMMMIIISPPIFFFIPEQKFY